MLGKTYVLKYIYVYILLLLLLGADIMIAAGLRLDCCSVISILYGILLRPS